MSALGILALEAVLVLRRIMPSLAVSAGLDEGAARSSDSHGSTSRGGSLRALIVSQPTDYGVAVCVRHLVEGAVAAGHEVTVACPGSLEGPLSSWVESAEATHRPLDLRRAPSVRDFSILLTLRRMAKRCDVLHLHSSKAGALGRLAVLSLPAPQRPAVVFTPHSWSWEVGGRAAVLYRWIERRLAPTAAIVAVSEEEASEGRAVLGSTAGPLIVIHNGVDRERFRPDGPVAERDLSAPLIVCVGRLSEQKGQDVAIRALARMRYPFARLRLVGGESTTGARERLEALARDAGVSDRVEWRGMATDAAAELRAADVVIAPSRWEGMSLALLEAMACGAAVVATSVSGSAALGKAGIVVPPNDAVSLAQAMDLLVGDHERQRRLGAAARRRSEAFDLRDAVSKNLLLWSELADVRSVAPPTGAA